MESKLYCSVRIWDIAYSADKEYAYAVPPEMRDSLRKGSLVLVPFGGGNRLRKGIVMGFSSYCEYDRIKSVSEILEDYGVVSEETAALSLFLADRCFCSVGSALKAILPPGMDASVEYVYSKGEAMCDELNDKALIVYRAVCRGALTESQLVSDFGAEVKSLVSAMVKSGVLNREKITKETVNQVSLQYTALATDFDTAYDSCKTEKQKAVIDTLALEGEISLADAQRHYCISRAVIMSLVKKGICKLYEKRVERNPFASVKKVKYDFDLTDEQQTAADEIGGLLRSDEAKAALLYGITGSGKTRVIIDAVKQTLELGKTAIVLIPEIGLTAEAMSIYYSCFGNDLAVVHSMLSEGERIDTARAIARGDKKVVIGTRSAVFAPLKNLGLIVMDEEQEHTYKSENTPKFHARDVARFRCAYHKCVMLLASATPSVESYYKATQGVYKLITLKNRYGGASLPKVVLEDVKRDVSVNAGKLIGGALREKLENTVSDGKQAIIYVGRRGYSAYVSCASCGQAVSCPNCSVSLTYHAFSGENRKNQKLSCHYCGYSIPLPEVCPSCGKKSITRYGFGTQKLQEELEKYYPEIRAIRMDTDTTSTRHSHESRFKDFRNHKADLLYGTQMISKGLDFPLVSLVGVVSVDALLFQNDFRAAERTFSLLTQLAGRAGRSEDSGTAILQTNNPQSDILKLVEEQDYIKFFEGEIAMRRAVKFPPFCDVAVFRISGENEGETRNAATAFSVLSEKLLKERYQNLQTVRFGPFTEEIYKLNNRFRMRMVFKYKDSREARDYFRNLLLSFEAKGNVTAEIDINPTVI